MKRNPGTPAGNGSACGRCRTARLPWIPRFLSSWKLCQQPACSRLKVSLCTNTVNGACQRPISQFGVWVTVTSCFRIKNVPKAIRAGGLTGHATPTHQSRCIPNGGNFHHGHMALELSRCVSQQCLASLLALCRMLVNPSCSLSALLCTGSLSTPRSNLRSFRRPELKRGAGRPKMNSTCSNSCDPKN